MKLIHLYNQKEVGNESSSWKAERVQLDVAEQ